MNLRVDSLLAPIAASRHILGQLALELDAHDVSVCLFYCGGFLHLPLAIDPSNLTHELMAGFLNGLVVGDLLAVDGGECDGRVQGGVLQSRVGGAGKRAAYVESETIDQGIELQPCGQFRWKSAFEKGKLHE
jgi:hypothetical protein